MLRSNRCAYCARVALQRRVVGQARYCSLIALASIYLAAVASCAHRPPRVRRAAEDSESVELPACPTPVPPVPEEVSNDGRYGVVLVGYTIEPDGRVDEIELDDPRASPLLFAAAKDWLEQCRSSRQGRVRPTRISELLSFPPPDVSAVGETPVPLDVGSGMSLPQRGPNCTPDRPPAAVPGKGTLTVEYVVQSNGRVGETLLKGGNAPKALFKTVRAWLQSCPYAPAMRDGKPVAVSLSESFTF